MSVVAVQKTKLHGSEILDLKSHTIFKSGKTRRTREFGVAFVVDKKLRQQVTDFKPINERMCTICFRMKFFKVWFVNAHTPTEDKEEEEKENFYERLELLYDSLPRNDVKIIMGDFNAKIGNEKSHRGTTGGHSLHDTSSENAISGRIRV